MPRLHRLVTLVARSFVIRHILSDIFCFSDFSSFFITVFGSNNTQEEYFTYSFGYLCCTTCKYCNDGLDIYNITLFINSANEVMFLIWFVCRSVT